MQMALDSAGMAVLIDTNVTSRVIEMADAIEVIENAFTQLGEGDAVFQPRTDIWSPTAHREEYYRWGSLLGATRDPPRLALRFKSDILRLIEREGSLRGTWYNVEPGTYMGFVLLFNTSTGALIGLLNDGKLQHVRVGATAGVASKYLAREESDTIGMLGSSDMAESYLEAFATVRELTEAKVFSPTRSHRRSYARRMSDRLDIDVRAVDSPREAVRNADIVGTCTSAKHAVFNHEWLEDGQFLVNVKDSEMDDGTYENIDRVITTTNEPYLHYDVGSKERREETYPMSTRGYQKTDYQTLDQTLAGEGSARQNDSETILYNNRSAGIQFAAVADLVHRRATDRGLGTPIPLDWFQQDIRN